MSACLNCRQTLDAPTGLPNPFTICIYCGAIMKLRINGTLGSFTNEEMDALLGNRDSLQLIMNTYRTMMISKALHNARN